jgi:hypothetical protein
MVTRFEAEICSVWLRVVLMSYAPLPLNSKPETYLKTRGRLMR